MISLNEDCTRAYIVIGNRRVEISIEGDDIVLRGDLAMPTRKCPLRARDLIEEELDAAARIKEHFGGAKRSN
jgi:hypothetical protein